jgi:hypothetical protein
MTPGDAYWVGAPGRGNPHSTSVVVNTCSYNSPVSCYLTVVSPDASSESSSS